MHFLVGTLVMFLIGSHPISRVILLCCLVELLAFALLPPVSAWVIVAVVTVALWAGAAEEMRARRQWREDDEMIRRAQIRQARRYLLK